VLTASIIIIILMIMAVCTSETFLYSNKTNMAMCGGPTFQALIFMFMIIFTVFCES
jgi:p-aminobenzoyl-glutamate transporter AbgT